MTIAEQISKGFEMGERFAFGPLFPQHNPDQLEYRSRVKRYVIEHAGRMILWPGAGAIVTGVAERTDPAQYASLAALVTILAVPMSLQSMYRLIKSTHKANKVL